jgi:hypothetical protein
MTTLNLSKGFLAVTAVMVLFTTHAVADVKDRMVERRAIEAAVWGSYGNIIGFAADGDILVAGLFGIKRWNI